MSPSSTSERTLSIEQTAGPLDAEARLRRDLRSRPSDAPSGLPHSVTIVTPSRSLRDHLQARLVAGGTAQVGVRVTTLFGLALEITEDLDGRLLGGRDLFPIFARRLAHQDKGLRQALSPLADGYSALLGSVRDLLDAGLRPAHAEALVDALEDEGRQVAGSSEVARAQGLVRVAAGCADALERLGIGRRSTLLATAADAVRSTSGEGEEVWIYGIADASGVALDLLEALLTRRRGRLYLDAPPDPIDRISVDAGVAFTERFRHRIDPWAGPVDDAASRDAAAAPHIEMFRALGSDGEVRETARRIRHLIDTGETPEEICVVVRQLGPYSRALRQQFGALGLPFSGYSGLLVKSAIGRRAEAFAEVLEARVDCSLERWLDLVASPFGGRSDAELRTAMATLGLGRLREAADLAADSYLRERGVKLPVRSGYAEIEDSQGTSLGRRLRHRYLPADALAATLDGAAALAAHFAEWQELKTLGDHLEALATLAETHLAWSTERPERQILAFAQAQWATLPADLELTRDEFTRAVADALREFGGTPLGGAGGGVQVLDVVEARGRTCRHLFLLGMNRGLFPRVVSEDPLLSDALRRVLSRRGFGVLPDLPDKLAGFDEERFLFAQLLSSSPNVTLSWRDTDDEQMPLAPSPLVERLRWGGEEPAWREPFLARPILARREDLLRSPLENGTLAALEGPRRHLNDILPLLAAEGSSLALDGAPAVSILDELDPPSADRAGRLGPYFGFVGDAGEGDPRNEQQLFVTTLEKVCGCPWQVFLRRLLGLEPVPDPLAALPAISPLLIGSMAHDVLEEIVQRGIDTKPRDLAEARQRLPRAIPWPEPKELERILLRTAERMCQREGIAVRGFPRMLARAVTPYLDLARRHDWSADEGLHVLGAEIFGELDVEDIRGRQRAVRFRVDRVDLTADGLVLTDYKTGRRTVSSAKTDASRKRHLLASVRSGERLQTTAYSLAGGEPGDVGRYLFIGPAATTDPTLRDVQIAAREGEFEAAFRNAVNAALAAWDSGSFFPRLVKSDRDEETFRCEFCDVRDACVRGDSGARSRLRSWTDREYQQLLAGRTPAHHDFTLLALWHLGRETAP